MDTDIDTGGGVPVHDDANVEGDPDVDFDGTGTRRDTARDTGVGSRRSAARATRAGATPPSVCPMRVGLISDTHGLLRPEAIAALRGSDRILHAGDIGDPAILDALRAIAPLDAIRGNNDTAGWASGLPDTARLVLGDVAVYLIHDLKTFDAHPPPAPVDVIVAGHSHRPAVEERDGVLVVNPGSAGRRRFSLPITVGELHIEAGRCRARIVPLAIDR